MKSDINTRPIYSIGLHRIGGIGGKWCWFVEDINATANGRPWEFAKNTGYDDPESALADAVEALDRAEKQKEIPS